MRLYKEDNGRDRFLLVEEETELLKHCGAKLKVFALAAVDTGFRAGELQTLRWRDVDFGRRNITVASGYSKNGEPRTNPMTQRLCEALQEWKATGNSNGDGLVFGVYRYRDAFDRARDAADLREEVCFHTLRHSYISRLMMAGVNVKAVQVLAGHKTIAMTMRYAHLAADNKRQSIGLLEALVTTKVTTGKVLALAPVAVNEAN